MQTTLFCKPLTGGLVFEKEDISFHSLDLASHLEVIHGWVNHPYALPYWNAAGSMGLLRSCYQCILQNPFSHSFAGFYKDKLICQFDVYLVSADELAAHISTEPGDCGFHLIMAPVMDRVAGLTVSVVRAFLEHYFSFPHARRMYAEPDVNNEKSIALLERCGFKRIDTIRMSYKSAHVYCYEKQR